MPGYCSSKDRYIVEGNENKATSYLITERCFSLLIGAVLEILNEMQRKSSVIFYLPYLQHF
jgi:hypothetical protein